MLQKIIPGCLLIPLMTSMLLALLCGGSFAIAELDGHPFNSTIGEAGAKLYLYGIRGQAIKFRIKGSGLASNWASPTGFKLLLTDSDSRQTSEIPVHPPEEITWSDTITYTQRATHDFTILCSFKIPTLEGSGTRLLSGQFKGHLIVPFNNESDVAIPVSVEVASKDRYNELWWTYEGKLLILCLGSILVLAAGVPLALCFDRLPARETPDGTKSVSVPKSLAGLVFLYFACFVLLHALLWDFWKSWIFT